MASRKCTLNIIGASGAGYSETYYYNGPSDATAQANIISNLAAARAQMLSTAYKVIHARIQGNVARQVTVVQLNGGAGFPGSQSGTPAPQEVALLTVLQSAGGQYNKKYLRGLPARIVQGDAYVPDMEFLTGAASWSNQLIGFNNWNVVGRPQSNSPFSLTSLVPTPPRGFSAVSSDLALSNGSSYRISKSKIVGYNGIKTVTQVLDPTAKQYQFGGAAPNAPDTSGNVKIESLQPYDNPITTAQSVEISRRSGGRPFEGFRGRRPTTLPLRQ